MDLVTQNIINIAAAPNLVAAGADGDTFVNDGRTFFLVDNADVDPINVTIQVQNPLFRVPGLGAVPFADIVFPVPAGTQRWITVPRGPYNDGNARVNVSYSAVENVTVGALRVPQN